MLALLLSLILALFSSPLFASEDAYLFPLDDSPRPQHFAPLTLDPKEIYDRTEQVLQLFQVPAEKSTASILAGIEPTASAAFLQSWIRYVDASQSFPRFFTVTENSFTGFRDRDSKSIADFQMPLARSTEIPARKSLRSLRIALDPGHIGSDYWDKATGKYVKDKDGTVVSEGVINLQVCLLLKEELERLGAIVMITHEGLSPVSEKSPKDLDLNWFGKMELRARSLDSWFLAQLNSTSQSDLEKNFRSNSNFQSIFSESKRMNYFILREDLSARAEKVQAFDPDLTLIIHSDAQDPVPMDTLPEITRAYVPGALAETEYAGTRVKAEMAARLLQADKLQESLEISRAIVQSVSKKLNTRLPTHDMDTTIALEPGIFARNLVLNHAITKGATSYIECLMYGSRKEFDRLKQKDYQMMIDGKAVFYSQRLQDLAKAIRDAVANYYQ